MFLDLHHTRQRIADGHSSVAAEWAHSVARAQSAEGRLAFTAQGLPPGTVAPASEKSAPLAGLAVSIKDLFDVAAR